MSFTRQMSPYETTAQDRFMGTILVLSIVIAVYSLSKGSFLGSLTDKRIHAHTYFSQSYGILPGAEISLSGILVGHVESVALESRDRIKISVLLKPKYRDLYHRDSALKVNSGLGLDSVISGKGLEFIPGKADTGILESGAEIASIEPQSIDEMLDQWNVKELAAKAETIVGNLATVTQTLVDNQQYLVATMNNLSTTTHATSALVQSLPPVIKNINNLVTQLNSTVARMDENTEELSSDLHDLTTSSTALTQNLNTLVLELQPSVELMPSTISQLRRMGQQSTELMRSLNNHWLIGGSSAVPASNNNKLRFIGDDSIYAIEQGNTPTEGQ